MDGVDFDMLFTPQRFLNKRGGNSSLSVFRDYIDSAYINSNKMSIRKK